MRSKFQHNDKVRIKKYPEGHINARGYVRGEPRLDGKIWVTNLNMPFSGTISEYFSPSELELIPPKKSNSDLEREIIKKVRKLFKSITTQQIASLSSAMMDEETEEEFLYAMHDVKEAVEALEEKRK